MLYCSFEIVKAMFLQKGKFMILECEKCISLYFLDLNSYLGKRVCKDMVPLSFLEIYLITASNRWGNEINL